jgi:hypothetical protein
MAALATLADYELILGVVVPEEDRLGIERSLNGASDLVSLYLGVRAVEMATLYPDLLADLVVARVHRLRTVPLGIRSESVGGSSVTYDSDVGRRLTLTEEEIRLLNLMLGGGRASGIKSVAFTNAATVTDTGAEL